MSRKFNGTLDSAQSSGTLDCSASNKLSVALWLYWDAFAADDKLALELGASGVLTNGGFSLAPDDSSNFGGLKIGFGFRDSNGNFQYAGFTRPSAAAWHQYVLVMDGSLGTSCLTAYVDGTSQSLTYALNGSITGVFGNLSLNFMARNGGASNLAAGRIAEIGLWPGLALSANDAAIQGAGYRPIRTRPDALGWYWPCRYPGAASEPELVKANAMSLVETSSADHPRVIY